MISSLVFHFFGLLFRILNLKLLAMRQFFSIFHPVLHI